MSVPRDRIAVQGHGMIRVLAKHLQSGVHSGEWQNLTFGANSLTNKLESIFFILYNAV